MSKISKMQQRLATPAEVRKPVLSLTPKGSNGAPQIAENNFWDEAENMFRKSMLAIDQTNGELARHLGALIKDDAAFAKIEDSAGLLQNVELLKRDIAEHASRLNAIHAMHAGRVGSTKTPDENALVIQIHGRYSDAIEIYENNIMPIVSHIFEQIGAAELLLESERQAALMAQNDPNVITDVQVKEAATA